LTRLPAAETDGMIFVRLSPGDPIDVDAHLAGARDELAGFGLARYVRFARHEIERAMNWKGVVETFLEAYHVPNLHGGTLGPTILGAPAVWDAFGRSSRLLAVRRSIAELRARPESEWNLLAHAVVLYQLFPNTVVIHQIDHVEVVQVYPGSRGADSARPAIPGARGHRDRPRRLHALHARPGDDRRRPAPLPGQLRPSRAHGRERGL